VNELVRRREVGVLLLLVLMVGLVSTVNPAFLSGGNLRDVLTQAVPVLIVACGLTLVIVMGEIDISVGSLMGLCAAVLGTLASPDRLHFPLPVAVALTLLVGTGVGALNGLLVTWGRVPSIIVTLGMLTLLSGVTELVMGGEWIKNLPPGLRVWGTGTLGGVPVPILVAAVVFFACVVLAQSTPLGRRLYAAGGNPHAATLLGLRVGRLKLFAFTLTGFLTALATLVSVPQLSVIESGVGKGFELLTVTCVVVGGTFIRGGKGTLWGTLVATLLLVTVRTVLIFLRLGESATYWERAIQGAFILLAVLLDQTAARQRGGGAADPTAKATA
jgi:ribose/xylose/arabinose/galactoside ABC-type transport system permease subunit